MNTNENTDNTVAVSDTDRNRKLMLCIKALRAVSEDPGLFFLDEATQKLVESAREPIGGWRAGLERLKLRDAADWIEKQDASSNKETIF